MPRLRQLQRRLLFGERQGATLPHLRLNCREHGLQAVRIFAGQGHYTGRAFRIQVEGRGPVGYVVAFVRDVEAGTAHLLFGLRHRVTLLAVEEELRRVRLHDAGGRAFDAHGKAVAVRQSAAHGDARRERVFRNLHPVARVLLVQPRERDIGILRHRPRHRLA